MADDSDGYVAEPMHYECVVCHERSTTSTREEAAMTLLLMMAANDSTVWEVIEALCFEHRRRLEVCLEECHKEGA